MPLDRVVGWEPDKVPLTDSLLLVIYLLQRQGCPSQQVNQPTHARNIQTPSHLFHSHSGNLLQSNSLPLLLLTAHPLLSLPQVLTQWCLPCSVRRGPVAVTESHAAPPATSLFYLPTPTQPNLPPARLCASCTLHQNTKHKSGKSKICYTVHLLY